MPLRNTRHKNAIGELQSRTSPVKSAKGMFLSGILTRVQHMYVHVTEVVKGMSGFFEPLE